MTVISRLFLMMFACSLFCTPVLASSTSPAELVAKVGSVPITKYELSRQVQKILPLEGSYHSGVSQEKLAEIRKTALDDLIDQACMVQYALNEELAVPNTEVDKVVGIVKKRFKTEADFEKALGTESLANFRASIYRMFLAQQAEKVAIEDKVKTSDADLRAYYDANKSKFMRPRQYQASHILIKVDPALPLEKKAELKKKAEDLAKRAKAGEDFYNLAYYNSDDRSKFVGGDLGLFHEGQTPPEFEAALKKMKPGEISGPVKTLYGWDIIKLVKVNEPKQLTFEEMAGKIQKMLEADKRKQLKKHWLADLHKKFPVQVMTAK